MSRDKQDYEDAPRFYCDGAFDCVELACLQAGLDPVERLVLVVLASFASDTWDAVVSPAEVARAAGLDVPETKAIVGRLVERGIVAFHQLYLVAGSKRTPWAIFELFPENPDVFEPLDDGLACLEHADPGDGRMDGWGLRKPEYVQ